MSGRVSERAVRTAVVAALATWLTAASHVASGGGRPDVLGLAVAAVGVHATATWLGRERRGVVVQTAALTLLQVLLHGWFTLSASGATCAGAALHGGTHGGHASSTLTCHTPVGAAAGAGAHPALLSPAMLTGHLLAALATAALLLVAERGLRALLRTLSPLPVLPGRLPRPLLPTRTLPAGAFLAVPGAGPLVAGLPCRRGPPVRPAPRAPLG